MGRKSTIPEIEAKLGKPLYTALLEMINKGAKPPQIAEELGVSQSKAYEFINSYNLKDKMKEVAKNVTLYTSGGELKELMMEFVRGREVRGLAKTTTESYKSDFGRFLWWLNQQGITPVLGAFSHQTVQDFLHYLKTETNRFNSTTAASKREAKNSTLRVYYKRLNAFGNWLAKMEYVEDNPMKKLDPPKVEKRLPEDLPDDEIEFLLNSFDTSNFTGLRNKCVVTVFLDCGIRLGGMTNMQYDKIDLESGWGSVIEKGNKERKIHLSQASRELMREYDIQRREILQRRGVRCPNMWITEEGRPFTHSAIGGMVRDLNKVGEFSTHIHCHLFRHVWARIMVESGISLMAMQVMGGWEDIELVRHYASAYSTETAWADHEINSPITRALGGNKNGTEGN